MALDRNDLEQIRLIIQEEIESIKWKTRDIDEAMNALHTKADKLSKSIENGFSEVLGEEKDIGIDR